MILSGARRPTRGSSAILLAHIPAESIFSTDLCIRCSRLSGLLRSCGCGRITTEDNANRPMHSQAFGISGASPAEPTCCPEQAGASDRGRSPGKYRSLSSIGCQKQVVAGHRGPRAFRVRKDAAMLKDCRGLRTARTWRLRARGTSLCAFSDSIPF